MSAIKTGKRTQKYTTEFKIKAVQWSHLPHRGVKEVADALDIHPFMLSRWRKEYREGKFGMPTSKKPPSEKEPLQEQDELKRLKRRVAELEEENDILKKWQRFQAEEQRKRSGSSGNSNDDTP